MGRGCTDPRIFFSHVNLTFVNRNENAKEGAMDETWGDRKEGEGRQVQQGEWKG